MGHDEASGYEELAAPERSALNFSSFKRSSMAHILNREFALCHPGAAFGWRAKDLGAPGEFTPVLARQLKSRDRHASEFREN
jgi:hypothetical protein